jgi:glycosyltransferase involved in cell wall biosynthesis
LAFTQHNACALLYNKKLPLAPLPAMNFKVSVVIPVFNAAPYIREAVQSALDQDQVAEVLLIEDGSTDGSLQICRELAAAEGRIVLINHDRGRNRGAAATRNAGIRAAASPYITFLDADDVYRPNRFAKAEEIFTTDLTCQGVYEAIGMLPARDPMNKPVLTTLQETYSPDELFYHISPVGNRGYFSLIGLTVKREVFDTAGMLNDHLQVSQDTEWMLRLVATCRLLPGSLREPVSLRRIHAANRTTNDDFMRKHKPVMALTALDWFVSHQLPADKTAEILRVFLKYHFEWVHLSANGNKIWRKWKDLTTGVSLWWRYPELRTNAYLQYHLRTTFKLRVPKHLNYYESRF